MTVPAKALGLPTGALPPLEKRLDFVAEALAFAREHRGDWAFRFLRAFTRCTQGELESLMGKVFCDSHPNTYGWPESLAKACWKSLAQPFYYLATKKFLWKREPEVVFDFEAVDPSHFRRWFSPIFDRLEASKRITRSAQAPFPDRQTAEPASATASLRSLLLLFLAPLWIIPLLRLSRRYGRNLIPPYRKALGVFAAYDGHFRRYPCRHFVTFADDSNPPARYLAFRRNCPGQMAVVQNGERTHHPVYAFGMTDVYFAFGESVRRLAADLRIKARVIPVGALYLNGWLGEAASAPLEPLYDVLLIDQNIWPYNELDPKTGKSFEKLFLNLNLLKRNRPGLRVAFQLRHYADSRRKEEVLGVLQHFFTEPIEILGNDGTGESYRSIARSRLVLSLNSTLGYEAFFLGKGTKALFVNYAANPYEIYSDDPRFQLYDESADYGRFERHVEFLLALDLPEPPPAARERHAAQDGRVQERIAQVLAGEFGS